MTYRIRSRAKAEKRDHFMINLLALMNLAAICLCGFEALIIARLSGH